MSKYQPDSKNVLLNVGGVILDEPATSYMIQYRQTQLDVHAFHQKLLSQCGQEGPLKNVSPREFETAYNNWKHKNDGESVVGYGTFLRACRHDIPQNDGKRNIFPKESSQETTYTRNLLTRGMSLAEIYNIFMKDVKLTEGIEETVDAFRQRGITRHIFSNGPQPPTDILASRLGIFGLGEVVAVPTFITYRDDKNAQKICYNPRTDLGRSDTLLTGEVQSDFNLNDAVIKAGVDIPLVNSVAVVDNNFKLCETMRTIGGSGVAFRPKKYQNEFTSRNITVTQNMDELRNHVLNVFR